MPPSPSMGLLLLINKMLSLDPMHSSILYNQSPGITRKNFRKEIFLHVCLGVLSLSVCLCVVCAHVHMNKHVCLSS